VVKAWILAQCKNMVWGKFLAIGPSEIW
jgi:hypothetical protein